MTPERLPCEQCGKPAVGSVGGVNLCVDCLYKIQAVESARVSNAMRRANHAIDSMEMLTGVGGFPRYQVTEPQQIIQRGPMTVHNIKVDRSIVGAINSGDVQKIEVAMSNIYARGDQALATSIKDFTEAILQQASLAENAKNELVEQVSFLASQAQSNQREKPSILKSVFSEISGTVAAIASLASLWEKLEPLVRGGLGL